MRRFEQSVIAMAAVAGLLSTTAQAHPTALSYLELELQREQVKVSFDLPAVDLADALDLDAHKNHRIDASDIDERQTVLTDWLGSSLRVLGDGTPCRAERGTSALHEPALLTIKAVFVCDRPPKDVAITARFAEAIGDGFKTFVRFTGGGLTAQTLITSRDPSTSFSVTSSAAPLSTVVRFIGLGMEHIFTGYDHILFLLALLMLGGGVRRIIMVATAFTAAHSITLSLAALGKVTLPSRFVESAIAASIAYIAVENFLHAAPTPGKEPFVLRWRWAITFFFGLVHGFGFASALGDLGLTRSELPIALACFNVGVEIGQIVIIALAYPLLTYVGRTSWYRPRGVYVGSSIVFSIAIYWFSLRAFAG